MLLSGPNDIKRDRDVFWFIPSLGLVACLSRRLPSYQSCLDNQISVHCREDRKRNAEDDEDVEPKKKSKMARR